jgi:hypothetical protein
MNTELYERLFIAGMKGDTNYIMECDKCTNLKNLKSYRTGASTSFYNLVSTV